MIAIPLNSPPMTPPNVAAMRKRPSWKPDKQGRLTYRPYGFYGSVYVVETTKQLHRIERVERIKAIWMVVAVGAVMGAVIPMQADDASLSTAIGSVAVVVALVAGLIAYLMVNGARIVIQTAMRKRP